MTLELAALYIKEGRTSEVRDLAREMIEVFRAQDVHREALAAQAVFHSAAVLETATVELTREIAARLRPAGEGATAASPNCRGIRPAEIRTSERRLVGPKARAS